MVFVCIYGMRLQTLIPYSLVFSGHTFVPEHAQARMLLQHLTQSLRQSAELWSERRKVYPLHNNAQLLPLRPRTE